MRRTIAIGIVASVTLVMGIWFLTAAAGTFDHRATGADAAQPTGAVIDAPANAIATLLNTGDDDIGITDDESNDDDSPGDHRASGLNHISNLIQGVEQHETKD